MYVEAVFILAIPIDLVLVVAALVFTFIGVSVTSD
jgi:hypothetical protein